MTLSEFISKSITDGKTDTPHFILATQIREANLPEPECEVKLVKGRQFRSDFYWPKRFCVEIDGLFSFGRRKQTGRHLQPMGYTKDQFKQLEIAASLDIPTHHFVPDAIYSGYAIWWLTLKLAGKDIGKPEYNPGVKAKKKEKKKSDNKQTKPTQSKSGTRQKGARTKASQATAFA